MLVWPWKCINKHRLERNRVDRTSKLHANSEGACDTVLKCIKRDATIKWLLQSDPSNLFTNKHQQITKGGDSTYNLRTLW